MNGKLRLVPNPSVASTCLSIQLIVMATLQAVKKAVTLTPTVRVLPSGIPYAPLLNLAAKAPYDPHSHGHSDIVVRSDSAPRWAGGVVRTSCGLVSKTFTTGRLFFFSAFFFQFLISSLVLSFAFQLPTTTHPYVCLCKGRTSSSRLFCLPYKPRQQPCPLLLHGRLPWYYLCLCRQIFCLRVPPEYGCFR